MHVFAEKTRQHPRREPASLARSHSPAEERNRQTSGAPLFSLAGFDFRRNSAYPPPIIQRKATVSTPEDPLEREADQAAESILGTAQPAPAGPAQPSSVLDADAAVRAAEHGGAPLPPEARSYFGPRFGHDFSRVRVHADGEAAEGARAVQARAYTIGNDIVFGTGQYAPATTAGKRLIAHELAHVVQQSSGQGLGASRVSPNRTVQRYPDEGQSCAGSQPVTIHDEGSEQPTCISENEFQRNYIDNYIVRATGLAIPGTTWENIDDSRIPRMKLTYKDGRTLILDVKDIPSDDVKRSDRVTEAYQERVYERRADTFIYPVHPRVRVVIFRATPNIISLRAGLRSEIKEMQTGFALIQLGALFASQIAALGGIAGLIHSSGSHGLFEEVSSEKPPTGGADDSETTEAGQAPGKINIEGVESPSSGAPNPGQKSLSSSELKGTGKITSDFTAASVKQVRRGKATAPTTVYEAKKASADPDTQAEVRMAERFADEGHDVHFRGNDKGGDLMVDGVRTDVKHPRTENIASAISSAGQQGADQVIIDGTTAKLTQEGADAGIRKFESDAMKYPKLRNLKTVFIVKGDGSIFIYHRTTSLKKAH